MSHNNETSRRDFLKLAAASGLALQSGAFANRLLATDAIAPGYVPQNGSNKALVVIFLRGGADPMNMLIPYGDPNYAAHRPTLAMDLDSGLIKLDKTFGLHPAMTSLQSLWAAGKLAPIVCAGSPHTTRSHFDAQDWMEFAAPGNRGVRDGWLNRYLAATQKKGDNVSEFRALGMQELLPRSLRGGYPVLAVPSSLTKKKSSRNLDAFERFYGEGGMLEGGEMMSGEREDDAAGVVKSGRITIETLRRLQAIVAAAEKKNKGTTVSGSSYPDSRFGQRLKQIALVLKANEGLEVAGIDYNGWDDHAQEGGAEGRMADRLRDFSTGISAFCQDLGPSLDNTTIVVMTEFGRTVKENGNSGTDHGHGGSMFV
ncbi:MAG: DUF1501 domain-containing protein, partial [Planctomycetota bacterium]|nr:DUF1501 domain-containing protein [Planctomycetota bacterium]